MAVMISPRTAQRYLRDLKDPQTHFRTVDGAALKNLIDLTCYLKACDKEAFDYHVSREHNHFSNWVEHAILDKNLADQMSLVMERNPMRIIVAKRINHLVHSATKPLTGRERAKNILQDAILPEEHFLTNDGRCLRNMWELEGFLQSADDNTIAYHVSPGKNDFSDWVAGALMDYELAANLMGAQARDGLLRQVSTRLLQLEAFKAHPPKGARLDDYVGRIKAQNSGL